MKKIYRIIIVVILLIAACFLIYNKYEQKKILNLEIERQNKEEEIKNHYNKYVKTNKDSNIYKLVNSNYIKVGSIKSNEEICLEDMYITYKNEYFKINYFDDIYYIHYKDVNKIDRLSNNSDRYKKYIVFNKNIITKDVTNFYDLNDKLLYTINKSYELPIIVNKKNMYGVEFNNRLVYVKKEDVSNIKDINNTELRNTNGVAVLNYHFFYDEKQESERRDCNQIICHSKSLFSSHLKYIKDNDILTLTMDEFEMYLNEEINLPKSVLITIDDGWRSEIGVELLEQYELNGTVFLITSWFEEIKFLNDHKYVEYHSHGDKLHDVGICPGGQGGAIKCLDRTKLLADLALSRKKLNGSKAFCYPFYEYNNYSISVLKEAGFTLSFAGGFKKANPIIDKFQIPRYVIYSNTTVNTLASYID